jgi:hypothetical protein
MQAIEIPMLERAFGGVEVGIRIGRTRKQIHIPEVVKAPLITNYGLGTDSTALLVLMVEAFHAGQQDARPDLIIFADTGSEKPNTYAYREGMNAYLAANGFPQITVVAKAERGLKHKSLHEECETLSKMPSLAYGGKSCSLKWKVEEMDRFIRNWAPAQYAWATGLPIHKLIGYDASPADMRRSTNPGTPQIRFHYPLRDAGLQRPQLKEIIRRAGLPDPGKSACWLCPATKKGELLALAARDPGLVAKALQIEARTMLRAIREDNIGSTIGLGRGWSWNLFFQANASYEMLCTLDALGTGRQEFAEFQALLAAKYQEDESEILARIFSGWDATDEGDCGAA